MGLLILLGCILLPIGMLCGAASVNEYDKYVKLIEENKKLDEKNKKLDEEREKLNELYRKRTELKRLKKELGLGDE